MNPNRWMIGANSDVQNMADTAWPNGPVPTMPGYGPMLDKPFSAMLTPEDQIHWLYLRTRQMLDTSDMATLTARIAELEARVTVLENKAEAQAETIAQQGAQIQASAVGGFDYDMTAGVYRPSAAAARRTWQGTHPYGMTVGDCAAYTVGQLGHYTVGDVGEVGRWRIMGMSLPDAALSYTVNRQWGDAYAAFKPADYIRRDELVFIDVDNLQNKTVMGLPDTSQATPVPPFAAFTRPATVEDIANASVMYNGHLITEVNNGN